MSLIVEKFMKDDNVAVWWGKC